MGVHSHTVPIAQSGQDSLVVSCASPEFTEVNMPLLGTTTKSTTTVNHPALSSHKLWQCAQPLLTACMLILSKHQIGSGVFDLKCSQICSVRCNKV